MRATHCCLHRSQPGSNEIAVTGRKFLRRNIQVVPGHDRTFASAVLLLDDKGRRVISLLEPITSFDDPWRFETALIIFPSMPMPIDQTDYSVVVKLRAPPPNSWKWEIYRAGRSSPIEQASVYFHTMAAASRAGKEALKQLLDKLHSQYRRWPAA
jgi:hypothetical protein